MNRYFIKLAYNGSRYHGWQLQENAHTVQAEINQKLSLLLQEVINVVGCGRTDTGVHAHAFFAHFDTENTLKHLVDLTYKLNRFLPEDIVIFFIKLVPNDLHSRFSAVSRTYRYYISLKKDPFTKGLSFPYYGSLDFASMQKASDILLKYNDFTSFSKLHTQTQTNLCKVTRASWQSMDNQLIFTITADRFLRNMVRAIVGTLVEIGKGKVKPDDMKTIIEAKNRGSAGFSVPAEGLFLDEVVYPIVFE
ncbi:MAG: tRNA pseudouridine(38-40) synthase TruA [Bacteroidales bacterium]|jgi:tRNA pseudouridine38-40 synthase|nr:tRNA pseudouridine(38-40) synthase TruA [Bacteroidales bacterium]